jgi:hypothetical protein
LEFKFKNYEIKAVQVLPKNNNLAERYLNKYAPLHLGKDFTVFNLTINGTGRYYYSPQTNILAVYILLEFSVARESFSLLPELKKLLSFKPAVEPE